MGDKKHWLCVVTVVGCRPRRRTFIRGPLRFVEPRNVSYVPLLSAAAAASSSGEGALVQDLLAWGAPASAAPGAQLCACKASEASFSEPNKATPCLPLTRTFVTPNSQSVPQRPLSFIIIGSLSISPTSRERRSVIGFRSRRRGRRLRRVRRFWLGYGAPASAAGARPARAKASAAARPP